MWNRNFNRFFYFQLHLLLPLRGHLADPKGQYKSSLDCSADHFCNSAYKLRIGSGEDYWTRSMEVGCSVFSFGHRCNRSRFRDWQIYAEMMITLTLL